MIATTMKGTCLVVVLVIIGCLSESWAYVSFDQVNPDNSSVSDDDLLKSAAPEQQGNPSTEKPKLVRLPLEPRRSRHAIENDENFTNANTNLKRRDSGHELQTTETLVDSFQKSMQKMHKKKSRMSKKAKTSKKTKRSIDNVIVRQLNGNPNSPETMPGRINKDKEYYAQRKAIIDRYHARNREITRKYQQSTSTTTEGPFRYNLGFGRLRTSTGNHRMEFPATTQTPEDVRPPILATTQPPKIVPPPLILATASPSEGRRYHVLEDKRRALNHDSVITTTLAPTKTADSNRPKDKDFWEVGECDALENLTMFYQHNLLLGIAEGITVDAEMMPPTDQGLCIVCATVKRNSGELQSIQIIESKKIVVKIASGQDVLVSLTVKHYTDYKKNGHC